MIKHINPQNILNSPFIAVKSRALSNTEKSDYILTEDGINGIALEYVDYNNGDPILNRACNIALEQQQYDTAIYQEGITGSRFFNSASDARNIDGTYKSLVYKTIQNAFYNTYRNPTEIFGLENVDFSLSNTLRNVSDKFRMFSLPKLQMGDKIRPQSLEFYDNLLDDNVTVFDDGYQNLIAGYNLFSKIQEVRIYPSGSNPQTIFPGTQSFFCPYFNMLMVTDPNTVYAYPGTSVTFSVSGSGDPRPLFYQWYSGSVSSSYVPISDSGVFTGSQSTILTINDVTPSLSGSYFIMVRNSYAANHTTSVGNLIVLPPKILIQPSPQTNYKTDLDKFNDLPDQYFFTASFNVSAYGGLVPLTYQWYSGISPLIDDDRITGSYIVNGNSASIQINCLQFNDSGDHYVAVSNGLVTTSSHVQLTVLDNDIPTEQSDSIGQTISLLYGNANSVGVPYSEGTITNIGTSLLTGSVISLVTSIYGGNESSSYAIGFDGGLIFNSVISTYGGNESSSYSVGFDGGQIFDVLNYIYGGNESSSYSVGFDGGYLTTIVIPSYNDEVVDSIPIIGISLLTGSVI